jgi:hypothetical protein
MLPMNTSLDFQAQMMLMLNDTFSKLSTVIADNKNTDSHTNDFVDTTSNTTLNGKLYAKLLVCLEGQALQNMVSRKHL